MAIPVNRIRKAIMALSVSAAAVAMVAQFEGYREEAYLDEGGVPTIGYGETKGVKIGDTTTPERAKQQLLKSLDSHADQIRPYIKVPLYQHEFDAYASFAYSAGIGNFKKSTLLKLLNQKRYPEACAQLKRWVYIKGKYSKGLANRRNLEYRVCMGQAGTDYKL